MKVYCLSKMSVFIVTCHCINIHVFAFQNKLSKIHTYSLLDKHI